MPRPWIAACGVWLVTLAVVVPATNAASCPTSVRFEPTASGTLDAGWTGIDHGLPLFGTTLDLALTCTASTPPCGTCTIAGLVPTAYPERCRNDSARPCTVASEVSDCGAPGTCTTFLSPPQSLGIGGLPLCYTTAAAAPVTGSVDVESGFFRTHVTVRTEIRAGILEPETEGGRIQGCARCVGDPVVADGVRGGTCDEGPRQGLGCDAHAVSPYADFGAASFDCPTTTDVLADVTLGPITAASEPQTVTLGVGSPACIGVSGRCFCSTCNSLAADPCMTNADCPPSGGAPGICNGRRCLAGGNAGTPCAVASECPSGFCGRPGTPTEPDDCVDDTTAPNDCSALGECTAGPVDTFCANHPDRGCLDSSACDGVPGACAARFRPCFTDNGVLGASLSVTGTATPPVNGVAEPTDLGAFTCVPPLGVDIELLAGGFPGLARTHQPGRLVFTDALPPADICPPAPAACRTPIAPERSTLRLTDLTPDTRDQLQWKWNRGTAMTVGDLGNPTTADEYVLCLYDASGVRSIRVPAGGFCGTKPCWQAKPTGFSYRNRDAGPQGIVQLDLRAGADGKARATVKGKGDLLPVPALASLSGPLTVQLRNRTTGFCLGTAFLPPFDKHTSEQFRDRSD